VDSLLINLFQQGGLLFLDLQKRLRDLLHCFFSLRLGYTLVEHCDVVLYGLWLDHILQLLRFHLVLQILLDLLCAHLNDVHDLIVGQIELHQVQLILQDLVLHIEVIQLLFELVDLLRQVLVLLL